MATERPLCIYHGNCADGFGAAWVVWKHFGGKVDFHAGVYQDPPPDVTGRDVIMVDFSYKRPVLEEMAMKANSMLILDHHKSAAEDLSKALRAGSSWKGHLDNVAQDSMENANINGVIIYALFDMDRSGAGIAWDYFFGGDRPALINHIEDRDLWRFKLPFTREIQAALFSYPYDLEAWDALMDVNATGLDRLKAEGHAIERKHFKDIDELLKVTQRRMVLGGHDVPVANLPYTLTSDAGHKMCEANGATFAACYWDTPDGRVFSLRSLGDFDVSAVARQYGGGGHRNAAGFRQEIGWEGDV